MSNIIKYQALDLELVDEAQKQVDIIAGGEYENLEVGETVLRFLPAMAGFTPIRVTAIHYIDAVPGLDGKTIVFACPRVELKQPCPACAKAEELMKTGNPLDRERGYRIQAGLRVYANVLNRKKVEAGPKVLAFGKQIWDQLKAIRKNPRMGGDFTDPSAAGFDIIINREGTGKMDTKYTVAADRQNTPLADTDEETNRIISAGKDLERFVQTDIPQELALIWNINVRQVAAPPPKQPGTLVAAARAAAAAGTVGSGVMARAKAAAEAKPAEAKPPSAVADADDDFN